MNVSERLYQRIVCHLKLRLNLCKIYLREHKLDYNYLNQGLEPADYTVCSNFNSETS